MPLRPASYSASGGVINPQGAIDGPGMPGNTVSAAIVGVDPVDETKPVWSSLTYAWSGAETATAWTLHINAAVQDMPASGWDSEFGGLSVHHGSASLNYSVDGGQTWVHVWSADFDPAIPGGIPALPSSVSIPSLPVGATVGGLRIRFTTTAGTFMDMDVMERKFYGAKWEIADLYATPTIPGTGGGESGKKVLRLRIL